MRHTLRLFARNPLATAAALGALALAIGASTLVFSVFNGILLRPLGYRDPSSLVIVWETNLGRGRMQNSVAPANFLYWRDRQHAFTDIAAVSLTFTVNVQTPGQAPEMVPQQMVSAALFPILGVEPARGRVFTEQEDAAQSRLVVVSHRYWQTRFGGDRAALGRVLRIEGKPYTVIGVMPSGFSVLDPDADIWAPVGFTEQSRTPHGRFLATVARLKPGMTVSVAQSDMTGIAADLTRKFPDFDTGWGARVVPMHQQVTGQIRPALMMLLGAVGCLLLIACANVANLLLAGATLRQRELAVRATLGASRRRLIGQLLGESVLLAALAGAAGWTLAAIGLRVLKSMVTDSATIPRLMDVTLDTRVVGFAMALSLVAAILAGLPPAFAATRLALVESLKDGLRGSTAAAGARLRPLLVGLEVALAVVLIAGAGLLVRSLLHVIDVKPGFEPDGVQTLKLSLSGERFAIPNARTAFYDELIARTSALPGVSAAGAISFLPMTGLASATSLSVIGQPKPAPGQEPVAEVRIIEGDYFRAMGIPLVRGRLFQSTDTGDRAHVVIVNEALANQLFPGQDPLGHELVISWDSPIPDRIVGVVGNIRHLNLETPTRPMTYWPHARFSNEFMTLTVKTGQPADTLAPALGRIVRSLDPSLPVALVRPMTEVLSQTLATRGLIMWLLTTFAMLALVLAALGVYAVTTATVTERRGELAIRVALGAGPARMVRLVVGQALMTTIGGAAVGLAAAAVGGRLVAGLLFDVRPSDPLSLGGAVGVLVAVAVGASVVPGRVAARVDPMEALKTE